MFPRMKSLKVHKLQNFMAAKQMMIYNPWLDGFGSDDNNLSCKSVNFLVLCMGLSKQPVTWQSNREMKARQLISLINSVVNFWCYAGYISETWQRKI